MQKFKNYVKKSAVKVSTALLGWYQWSISPDHSIFSMVTGKYKCRFYPSCSAYAIETIRQYGLFRGVVASLWRVLRCGPWSSGGYDPVSR